MEDLAMAMVDLDHTTDTMDPSITTLTATTLATTAAPATPLMMRVVTIAMVVQMAVQTAETHKALSPAQTLATASSTLMRPHTPVKKEEMVSPLLSMMKMNGHHTSTTLTSTSTPSVTKHTTASLTVSTESAIQPPTEVKFQTQIPIALSPLSLMTMMMMNHATLDTV